MKTNNKRSLKKHVRKTEHLRKLHSLKAVSALACPAMPVQVVPADVFDKFCEFTGIPLRSYDVSPLGLGVRLALNPVESITDPRPYVVDTRVSLVHLVDASIEIPLGKTPKFKDDQEKHRALEVAMPALANISRWSGYEPVFQPIVEDYMAKVQAHYEQVGKAIRERDEAFLDAMYDRVKSALDKYAKTDDTSTAQTEGPAQEDGVAPADVNKETSA